MKIPSEIKEASLNILVFIIALSAIIGILVGGEYLIKKFDSYMCSSEKANSCENLSVEECIEQTLNVETIESVD